MREHKLHRMKPFFFTLLVLTVMLILPMQARAYTDHGKCGVLATWHFYKDTGTLEINGFGSMKNYGYTEETQAPWFMMAEETDDSATQNAYGSDKIEKIVIGKNITSIGDYAFDGLYIDTVTLPDGLKTIGAHAFAGTEHLTLDKLPSSVQVIKESAFSESSLGESITLPSSCTTIGKYAFAGTELRYVEIPSSVTDIGKYAFGYYAEGWDDVYELDDTTPKKDIRKYPGFYILGPKSGFTSTPAFKYAKTYKLDYVMKGVKGPKIKSARNVRTRRIQLKWKKVSKASGYQIRYSTSKKFAPFDTIKYITINSKKTTSRKTAKLKKKKTYYISIRYFKKAAGKKVFSEWTTPAKKVKIKK
ncbi:MAG: leucine-rich repeat domain-containing protein [Eubacterium sp.]|nr:leucine-rich repeat domain-containing protein [Eubacterium sp.]